MKAIDIQATTKQMCNYDETAIYKRSKKNTKVKRNTNKMKENKRKVMQQRHDLRQKNMIKLADILESVSVKNGRWVHEQLQSEIEDEDKFWDEEIEREYNKWQDSDPDEQACWGWNAYQYQYE